ncbi:MAG: condensation domain-containing protein [Rhizomicrobium sp.]
MKDMEMDEGSQPGPAKRLSAAQDGRAPPLAGDGQPHSASARDAADQVRARNILGLDGLAATPALPPRAEHLWRMDRFAADVPFTNAMFIPVGQITDRGLLHETVATVVNRHEALRTRLAVRRGRVVQIAEDWKVKHLEITDVLQSELADVRPGQTSAVSAFTQGAMDLYAQDGFRCHAFRDEIGDVTLGLLAHGFFADAWSSQILFREIHAVRDALEKGASAGLQPAPQYAQYALAQRQSFDGDLSSRLAYWQGKLKDMPPSRLPYDRDADVGRRGRSFFFLDQKIVERLAAVAQENRVSLTILLLAAYQLSLARWSGQREILSAAYTADRVNPRFQNTIGFLVANMPVCSRIDRNAALKSFLPDFAREYYGSYAHRELSCELYEAIFTPDPPFCASVFNFIPLRKNFSGGELYSVPSFDGVVTAPDAAKPAIYRDIYLGLSQHPNGILGKVFYNTGRFSSEATETFIRHFRHVVQTMATDPDAKLHQLLD